MEKIAPTEIYNSMNNFVDFEKEKDLDSITITCCICILVTEIKGYNNSFNCHCFKCRICRISLSVLVERKRHILLLLINTSNYNIISEDIISNNVNIWG